MHEMTPLEKENWIEKTVVHGMKDADREVKFLHRAVLSGSSDAMRDLLDRSEMTQPALVEVKFNWSHGHSTPKLMITHASEEGEVNTGFWDPYPVNYKIQWMIRNEDFFILRWGDPDFIRDHIKSNRAPYVNGYHIGSEGYIPAFDYFSKNRTHGEWQYAFERQWLFYTLWGRLLYDTTTPDLILEQMFNQKYNEQVGQSMLDAYKLASKMPQRLGAFFKSTWDYTLYSEGFLAPMLQERYGFKDVYSPFISLDELIDHKALDTTYLSIKYYVSLLVKGISSFDNKISPEDLSAKLLFESQLLSQKLDSLHAWNTKLPFSFKQELADLEIWGWLSRYWGYKIKAGIATEFYRRSGDQQELTKALTFLDQAKDSWKKLATIGARHYRPVPYWESRVFGFNNAGWNYFSWKKYMPEVERDFQLASKPFDNN
jgi:hypothetical protein